MKGLAFHCHHDTLVEYVHDYDEMVGYIKNNKPENERELRLRLFKMIPDELVPGKRDWAKVVKAWDAYDKAWDAYIKAWNARVKAWNAYIAKHQKELEELHMKLCPDCPWDGKTIFPRKD